MSSLTTNLVEWAANNNSLWRSLSMVYLQKLRNYNVSCIQCWYSKTNANCACDHWYTVQDSHVWSATSLVTAPSIFAIQRDLIYTKVCCNLADQNQLTYSICCTLSYFVDVTLDGAALVRLVGGATVFEGRVEVFFLGQWGTVCNYNWDLTDATVICRQLGYVRAVEVPSSASFGAGSGPSWYSNVRCVGTEMNLTECIKSISHTGSACSHSLDAAVICSSKLYNYRLCL